jgi:serine phosphatase RsbU (regulator of sigma subunit)
VELERRQLVSAKRHFLSALGIAKEIRVKPEMRDNYLALSVCDSLSGDFRSAYEYHKMYSQIKDSILNEENQKHINEMQARYESEKKDRELTEKDAEIQKQQSEAKQKATERNGFIAGFVLVLALAFFIFSGYRQKQRANRLLEEKNVLIEDQKKLVETKNKNITDSINYAQRIQNSILPPDWLVKKLLPDSFVFYRAKDIVSGDFYWVEEKGEKVLFAAVDCTGHGVPGAMMSVLGFNLLTQAVNEKNITKPSDILQHLDWGVNQMLRQSTEQNTVKDGMDLALCAVDFSKRELQYAGAYNGMWVIKNKTGEILEVKADKSPIGVNVGGVVDHYTNHVLQLEKGDTVYIFSDGYADQFGGPYGKKFKYRPMKELLARLQHQSMDEQGNIVEKTFDTWMGNLEQVDDVLVIGIRV